MNSCNPVFMDVGARVGVDGMYQTFRQLGLFEKTGIDLPGEASSIMHQKKNVGAVELATMSLTVHTDHTVTAVKSSQCGDQRREADHTAFWKICSEAGWNKIKSFFLFSERRCHKNRHRRR